MCDFLCLESTFLSRGNIGAKWLNDASCRKSDDSNSCAFKLHAYVMGLMLVYRESVAANMSWLNSYALKFDELNRSHPCLQNYACAAFLYTQVSCIFDGSHSSPRIEEKSCAYVEARFLCVEFSGLDVFWSIPLDRAMYLNICWITFFLSLLSFYGVFSSVPCEMWQQKSRSSAWSHSLSSILRGSCSACCDMSDGSL